MRRSIFKQAFSAAVLLLAGLCSQAQTSKPALPVILEPTFKADTFKITKYGAVADGKTLNTQSIEAAITACSNNGGGVVLVEGGLWLTGPITLKSNVNLHLAPSAVLLFSGDFNLYPIVEAYYEGLKAGRCQSPISGHNLQNVAITGQGIIDGNGDLWRMVKKDKLNETQWAAKLATGGVLSADKKVWYPTQKSLAGAAVKDPGVLKPGITLADFEAYKDYLRPVMLDLYSCDKVLLQGVTFQNSPAWNLHPFLCNNVTLRGLQVKNPWYGQNGDGIDLEACKNTLIENTIFDVGDDGICIKSGRDEQGRALHQPTENLIVRNCFVYHAHGGFVIGSEMSAGVRNCFVSNCTFIGTDIGLRFKTARGRGGVVENIYVDNIVMKDIAAEAILFDMYYQAKDPVVLAGEQREAPKVETLPVTEGTPQFKDFYVNNITCSGASTAIFVRGLPEMKIKNIFLNNLNLTAQKGIICTQGLNINISNLNLNVAQTNPVISIDNSSTINLNNITYNAGSQLLFKISGNTSNVNVNKTSTKNAATVTTFADGATAQAIKIN